MVVAKDSLVGACPAPVDARRIAKNNLAAAGEKLARDMEPWAGWFLLAVRSGREQAVADAMADAEIRSWLPQYDEERVFTNKRRGGKRSRRLLKDVVRVMAFPGYIAVWLVPSAQAWHGLMGFENVIGLVGADAESWSAPQPEKRLRYALSERIVSRIKRMEIDPRKDLSLIHRAVSVGEAVRILDGPFQGLQGVVARCEPKMAVAWVDVELFGRVTPVELWLDHFEKCS